MMELIVIIFMIGLISTVMLANFKKGDRQKKILLAADGLTNITRLAQNYTVAGKQIQRTSGACSGNNTISFYQIDMSSSSSAINLYAIDTCGTSILVDAYSIPSNTRIRPNGIAYEVCSASCATTNVSALNIRFAPPFGRMTGSGRHMTDPQPSSQPQSSH